MICDDCGNELVEVDNPMRREVRHRRGVVCTPLTPEQRERRDEMLRNLQHIAIIPARPAASRTSPLSGTRTAPPVVGRPMIDDTARPQGEAATSERPFLNRKIALDTTLMPCPRCRRGACEQPSGRYIVTATYEAVVIAHSHEEALVIADDAKYDHRVESMRLVHPDTADVRWPDA